jgi:uncharacterized PurR-regulated membrane protein YhhQ (DUF165 family)
MITFLNTPGLLLFNLAVITASLIFIHANFVIFRYVNACANVSIIVAVLITDGGNVVTIVVVIIIDVNLRAGEKSIMVSYIGKLYILYFRINYGDLYTFRYLT